MALTMVHLLAADLWARRHAEYLGCPEFYLGAISPDAIHIRYHGDKARKDEFHLYNWRSLHREPLLEYWRERRGPFDIGYGVHVLTDCQWVQSYIRAFPAIIRPDPEGGYEMVAGHRRLHAADLAGLKTIPAIVRELTDDEAVILMVDSNLQRETITPMERAQAYRMKLEALKHQGKRVDLEDKSTSTQIAQKLSVEKVAEEAGTSRDQVRRYIRLTELLPEVQEKVDSKEIAFSPAVELSYLTHDEQKQFLEAMDYSQNTPSLSQAQRLKKLSREGKCTQEAMFAIMSEEKKDELDRITLKSDILRKYFPRSYTPLQMQQTIIKLLEQWQKKRQRQNER